LIKGNYRLKSKIKEATAKEIIFYSVYLFCKRDNRGSITHFKTSGQQSTAFKLISFKIIITHDIT
jgi:hypothetical protein